MCVQLLPCSAAHRKWTFITALLCAPGVVRLPAQVIAPTPPAVAPDPGTLENDEGAATHAWPRFSLKPDARKSSARERGVLTATFGPYTRHTGKGNYNSQPAFSGLEWETVDRWTVGAAYFKNSFWQPCWFGFVGRRFTFNGRNDGFFVKVVAGAIHGYRSPHEKSVSLNYRANCPAIVPSVGYKFKRVTVQLVVFGTNAGQMPLVSHDLR